MEAPVSEYLRVDEIASRFGVSIDDVLAACSLLGFPVHDRDGLVELDLFTHALMAAAPRPIATAPQRRRPSVVAVLGAAAALIVVVAGIGITRPTPGPSAGERAAAYRAQLKSTFESTVDDNPNVADYQTLAKRLDHIEPPASLRAAHAELVAEAQEVAALTSEDVTAPVDTTAAVDALREHVAEVEGGLPTP